MCFLISLFVVALRIIKIVLKYCGKYIPCFVELNHLQSLLVFWWEVANRLEFTKIRFYP
jgi:hypothetical protein